MPRLGGTGGIEEPHFYGSSLYIAAGTANLIARSPARFEMERTFLVQHTSLRTAPHAFLIPL